MPLIIPETSLFEIKFFLMEKDDQILFSDKPKEGYQEHFFKFKRPDWSDNREIISSSMSITSNGLSINPWRIVDLRMKLLLRQWSLKDDKDKMIPVTETAINSLHPALVEYLNDRINEQLEGVQNLQVNLPDNENTKKSDESEAQEEKEAAPPENESVTPEKETAKETKEPTENGP